jgi:hypothetical protein
MSPSKARSWSESGIPRGRVARYHDKLKLRGVFIVDELTAEAIRRAHQQGGELAGVVEFKRHFPLISEHAKAWHACGSTEGGSRRRQKGNDAAPPMPATSTAHCFRRTANGRVRSGRSRASARECAAA